MVNEKAVEDLDVKIEAYKMLVQRNGLRGTDPVKLVQQFIVDMTEVREILTGG